MHIMTASGWKPLRVVCQNEIWELSVWDEKKKELVRDSSAAATLNFMGFADHIKEAPPMYRGPLPSPECVRYIDKQVRDHHEWLERREAMISNS